MTALPKGINFILHSKQTLYVLLLLVASIQNFRQPVLLDDAYITFRAVRNFARGKGLVFNPSEKVLSTTAPGFAVLLAGLNKLGLDIVAAAKGVSVLGLVLLCFSLLKLATRHGAPELGFAAGFVLCLFPDLIKAWGNECALLLGLAGLALLLYEFRSPLGCALAVVAGCAIRPDFAILALTLAAFWFFRDKRLFLRYVLAGGVLSLVWILFLHHLSGTFFPNTLAIKRQQGHWLQTGDPRAFAGWVTFARGLAWLLRRIVFDRIIGFFMILGGLLLISRKSVWAVVPCWAAVHTGAYYLLGVPGTYVWYFYPVWLLLGVSAGIGFNYVYDFFKTGPRSAPNEARRRLVLASLVIFCALNLYGTVKDEWAERKFKAYGLMAAAIKSHVRPTESVLMNEIGQMGYLSDCVVVDTSGLIHQPQDRGNFGDLVKMVGRYAPDYIVSEGWLAYLGSDYRDRVLAGQYELAIDLPSGQRVRYKQIDHVFVAPDPLPVLLKRQ